MERFRWYERLFAALYDPLLGTTENETLSPLRQELLRDLRGPVLDLGAGTGSNLPFFPAGGSPYVFLDRSFPMIRKGLSKGMRATGTPVIGSASSLPFPPETFGSVVVTLVLCSVDNLPESLREIHRTLKVDGTLYLMEHVLSDSPVIATLQHMATPFWKILASGCHLDRPTDRLVRSLFAEERARTTTISGIPFSLGVFRKIPGWPLP